MAATLATTADTYYGACGSTLQRRASAKNNSSHARSPSSSPSPSPFSSDTEDAHQDTHHPHSHVLADLRHHVLTYLADLEKHLSELPASQLVSKGESEAKAWLTTGKEMLERIRADVSSHLPELHTSEFVKSHIGDMDLKRPQEYVLTLSQHLQALQSHLSSFELPHGLQESMPGLKPHATINELIDLALAPKFVDPIAHGEHSRAEQKKAEEEIVQALGLAKDGARLIDYEELPDAWKSNPFVTQGYRCVVLVVIVVHELPS